MVILTITPRKNHAANTVPTSHRCEVPVILTFPGQHSDADAGVTELDEGQTAGFPILLSDQKNILGTNISMNEVFILLYSDTTGTTQINTPAG